MGGEYPPRRVLETLARLTQEHFIEVQWDDACEMRDVSIDDIEENYKTTITVSGWFYGLRDSYLILINEKSYYGYRVLAIPIGTITKIRILTRRPKKKMLRILKREGAIPVKVVHIYVKSKEASQVNF